MLSYWEKQSLLHYHYIVVGSGIVGLSTAISLREKNPLKRVLVLERSLLPSGASTKNAGFACFGSLTELLDDLQHMTADEVFRLAELRLTGLRKLRNRLSDTALEYNECGSYELISENEIHSLNQLEAINKLISPLYNSPVFEMADDKIASFGFNKAEVKHLVKNRFEGSLHTGSMMRALIDKAIRSGVEIKTGCTVDSFEESSATVEVLCSSQQQTIRFSCEQLCVCTNAFATGFFPHEDIQPGRGQVLLTAPIPSLRINGIFHFDRGYFYFRNLGNRILFGGGRNSDFEGERTTRFELNDSIQTLLEQKLREIIIPHTPFEVEQRWSGIMAFGKNKFPLLKRHSQRVVMGVRLGGMGVAIGTELGFQLAEIITDAV